MSIFSGLQSYAGKWSVKSVESMSAEDIAMVSSAHVVNSQYGLSCCFMMKAGNMHFIPMDQNCTTAPGEVLDLNKVKVITLEKQGEADIQRIRPE
jgi:hypothetical protein